MRKRKEDDEFEIGEPQVKIPDYADRACSKYSKASWRNKKELAACDECGCFHCFRVYSPTEINEWVGKHGDEAICPHCGIDAVIPAVSKHVGKWDFLPILGFLRFGEEFSHPLIRKKKR